MCRDTPSFPYMLTNQILAWIAQRMGQKCRWCRWALTRPVPPEVELSYKTMKGVSVVSSRGWFSLVLIRDACRWMCWSLFASARTRGVCTSFLAYRVCSGLLSGNPSDFLINLIKRCWLVDSSFWSASNRSVMRECRCSGTFVVYWIEPTIQLPFQSLSLKSDHQHLEKVQPPACACLGTFIGDQTPARSTPWGL